MAGEAYERARKFKILADEHSTLGTGEITRALDTSKGNRLKLPPYLGRSTTERFLFAVPDIQNVSQFEIVFTNDVWAGKDKPGDRNLYVLGLTLSVVKKDATGAAAEARDFSPQQPKALTRSPGGATITPRYSALFQDGRLRLKRLQHQARTDDDAATERQRVKAAFSPSCTAHVTAYTSGGPSDKFRAELSLARAEAVANELARLGMAPERIKTVSESGGGRRAIISIE